MAIGQKQIVIRPAYEALCKAWVEMDFKSIELEVGIVPVYVGDPSVETGVFETGHSQSSEAEREASPTTGDL